MRFSSLTYILLGVLVIAATYRILNQSPFPNIPADQSDVSRMHSFEQKSDPLPISKDNSRLEDDDRAPANLNTEPAAHDEVQLNGDLRATNQSTPTAKDEGKPDGNLTATHQSSEVKDAKQNLSYLAYYAYSEVPPETKPADTVLKSLEDTARGTPVEEIKRVADAFGMDFNFMKAVAKVESDFNPKERTGSYIGLFQLSNAEFQQYGSGNILDPRDNAVAAAYKFLTEDILFEITTHKKPSLNDIYLIHQQGWQGAAEHVSHSDHLAWKSMCATDEGRAKGERWCKRAIWGNTLPAIKHIWKTVDNVTSGAFVWMWQQRVSQFYSRYYEATAK
jgi:Transglycosylase SLT domain